MHIRDSESQSWLTHALMGISSGIDSLELYLRGIRSLDQLQSFNWERLVHMLSLPKLSLLQKLSCCITWPRRLSVPDAEWVITTGLRGLSPRVSFSIDWQFMG